MKKDSGYGGKAAKRNGERKDKGCRQKEWGKIDNKEENG